MRLIGIPTCRGGLAPAITASYSGIIGVANLIDVGHYPKMGAGVIYETQ